MIDIKFRIISYFGRTNGLRWKDLTDSELVIKELYCKDLLEILDIMNCGDCRKRGLILYELYCTKLEQIKRLQSLDCKTDSQLQNETTTCDINTLLKRATDILQNDVLTTTLLKSDKTI